MNRVVVGLLRTSKSNPDSILPLKLHKHCRPVSSALKWILPVKPERSHNWMTAPLTWNKWLVSICLTSTHDQYHTKQLFNGRIKSAKLSSHCMMHDALVHSTAAETLSDAGLLTRLHSCYINDVKIILTADVWLPHASDITEWHHGSSRLLFECAFMRRVTHLQSKMLLQGQFKSSF